LSSSKFKCIIYYLFKIVDFFIIHLLTIFQNVPNPNINELIVSLNEKRVPQTPKTHVKPNYLSSAVVEGTSVNPRQRPKPLSSGIPPPLGSSPTFKRAFQPVVGILANSHSPDSSQQNKISQQISPREKAPQVLFPVKGR